MSRLIPALLVCLITLSVVTYIPFGTETVSVVGADGDTITPLSLTNQAPIKQSILATGQPIKSLTFFSPQTHLTHPNIALTITDEQGHILAHSQNVSTTVADDRLAIHVAIPQLPTYAEQPLLITLSSPAKAEQAVKILVRTDDSYPNGRLLTPDMPQADLALNIDHPQANSFGFNQGVLLGIMLLLVTSVWATRLQHSWAAAAVLCLILATFLSVPFWFSTGQWGIDDWDYRFSLHETYRHTLLTFHEFPWWNPYICGGTAGLADPEFSLLSLTFIPELLFGVVGGIRVSIWLCFLLTSLGTLLVAKKLQFTPLAGWLVALTITATSGLMLKVVEGHETIVFAFMWLPWVLWAWLGAHQKGGGWPKTLWPGIILALIVYQGGIYILSYLVLVFAVLVWFMPRPRQAILTTVKAGVWAVGLSAFKLIPVLYWLREFPDRDYVGSTSTWPYLAQIFFGRYLHGTELLPSQVSGWHEYGAYIGLGVAALTVIGLSRWRNSRLTRALAVAAVLTIALSASGPWLAHGFDTLSFIPRSNISRLALLAVIPMALLAGQGLIQLERRTQTRLPWLPALIVGAIAIDLLSLAYPIGEQAFIAQPVIPLVSPAPSPLGFTTETYPIIVNDRESPRAYAAILAGYSTYSFCSVLGPQGGVNPADGQKPYAQIASPTSRVQVTSWTPNHVEVSYQASEPTMITINTNYAKGWRVNGQTARTDASAKRVGVQVATGSGTLEFRYEQPGRWLGLLLTVLTLVGAAILLRRA